MRTINALDIEKKLTDVITKACTILPKDVKDAIAKAQKKETSSRCKFAMDVLLENAEIAEKESVPICQDTGMAVFFVEIGQDVHIEGSLTNAINNAVFKAYSNGLRNSVLDPLSRENTKGNTPAIIII